MKIIELKGLGTKNKGAFLMLETVKAIINIKLPKSIFCYGKQWGLDYHEAGKNEIYKIINFPTVKKIPVTYLLSLMPRYILRDHGLILREEVDVILDGSGFAYGDFWGHEKIRERLGEFIDKKYPSKSKLILLPQAFGPFTDSKLIDEFKKVTEKASLIYARDKRSYEYLVETFGEMEKIKIAPDFTNLLDAGNEKQYLEGNVCIIPNYKVVSETVTKEKYQFLLKEIINLIIGLGGKPYFLIHEGKKDAAIAVDTNELLSEKLDIITEYDPIIIKNRIKSSELIIVSRFHGLVSALSQGIPVLTTSWSHKYQMLLEDYAQTQNLIDILTPDWDFVKEYIQSNLFHKKDNKRNYQIYIDREKVKSENCWNEIIEEINK